MNQDKLLMLSSKRKSEEVQEPPKVSRRLKPEKKPLDFKNMVVTHDFWEKFSQCHSYGLIVVHMFMCTGIYACTPKCHKIKY